MALALKHATPAQLSAVSRQRYKGAEKERALALAAWIKDRIDDGTFTQAQIMADFGFANAGQYTSFLARLNAHKATLATVQAAKGE